MRLAHQGSQWLVPVIALSLWGCGTVMRSVGQSTTEGVMEGVRQSRESEGAPGPEDVGRQTGMGMAEGAITQLTAPEVRAELELLVQRLVSGMLSGAVGGAGGEGIGVGPEGSAALIAQVSARAFAQEISNELIRQLGPTGEGPLATSLAATAERMSAGAIRGALADETIFPECQGPDRTACIGQQLRDLSRQSSIGAVEGARRGLGLAGFVVAFAAGLLAALILAWAWSVWSAHQGPRSTRKSGAARAVPG